MSTVECKLPLNNVYLHSMLPVNVRFRRIQPVLTSLAASSKHSSKLLIKHNTHHQCKLEKYINHLDAKS